MKLNLQYFAEGATAPANGGEGAAPETGVNVAENSGGSRRNGETVIYGKQEPQESISQNDKQVVDKDAEFLKLIKGEYKEQHEKHFQNAFNRRFGDYKTLSERAEKTAPILDLLQERYQTENGTPEEILEALNNDNVYFERAAEESGLTVEQVKHMQRIEAENRRYQNSLRIAEARKQQEQIAQKWQNEAEELQKIYPNFNFQKAMENERFKDLINPKNNLDMRTVYEVAFLDDIKNNVAFSAAKTAERDVVNNIRARGARPTENGAAAKNGVVVKDDPSKWTKKDRDEIEKRVLAGAKIRL